MHQGRDDSERRPEPEAFDMSTFRSVCKCWYLAPILGAFLFAVPTARAQFPGYGFGYGYPAYGNGFGFGMPGYGFRYGYPGMGFGYPGMGYGLGYGMMGFGMMGYGLGYGYPGFGYGVGGFPPVMPYGGFLGYSAYASPMVGVGLTPLGTQSYFTEQNMLGRAQYSADQRARARELLRYGR
jgi:hypothetical protein